jgi:D-glycerate 3-kinase
MSTGSHLLGIPSVPIATALQAMLALNFSLLMMQGYRDAWDKFVDCWLVVKVADPVYVYKWRLQAEHAMLATGKPGMTDEQVRVQLCEGLCLRGFT